MYPGFGLPVPYQSPISPPLSTGAQIHISGTATGNRFEVNLKNHQDDVVLHFNPRLDDNVLVLNSAQRGSWGQEERQSLPIYRGSRFTLVILATGHGFNIAVNNAHLCDFHQRMSSHLAQLVEVKGDISLESVQVYPGSGSMGFPPSMGGSGFCPPPPQPSFGGSTFGTNFNVGFGFPSDPVTVHSSHYPSAPVSVHSHFTGGSGVPSIQSCTLHLGSRIFARGYIHPNATRFELNLLQGYTDGDDIAFHFNPRFDTRTIVKNHRRNGQWGQEENQPFPSYMPLAPGATIDLQIACHSDRYTVLMNNHTIAEYYHKIPPGFVMALQYKGDITINSVGQI